MIKSIYLDENWGILQEEKEKGKSEKFVFEIEDNRIVYPFIKRGAGIIDGEEYFDIVTPRGQCGPWIEKVDADKIETIQYEFNREFTKFCMKENIIAELIRFSPWNDQHKYFKDIYDITWHGDIYCNDLSIDFFNEEYHKKRRNIVRKAKKNGVKINFGNDDVFVENFLALYDFTQQKYSVSEYYTLNLEFVNNYRKLLKEKVVFVEAVYQSKTIASAMLLLGGNIAHYHFAATDPDYNFLDANSLLLYESALYAKERGKKFFDLGGAKSGSSLEKFKKRTAKKYPYYSGKIIRNKEIYEKMVESVGGPRDNFFPAYRKK